MGKSLGSKYGQKLLDKTKILAADAFKIASKREIQKTAKAAGNLFGNKITEKNTKNASRNSHKEPKKSTQTLKPTSIPKEIYHQKSNNRLLTNFNYYNYKYTERFEYQKTTNLLDNTNIQLWKFRTKNQVQVNNNIHETYSKSSIHNDSAAYILVKGIITVVGKGANDAAMAADRNNKYLKTVHYSMIA